MTDALQGQDAVLPGLVGIGEVARLLNAEFGEVSVSKLRYLEARGLISPGRTRGGSRRYSAADIDRLRAIIIWQRREFLPLDVIAVRLDAGESPSSTATGEGRQEGPADIPESIVSILRPRTGKDMTPEAFSRRTAAPQDLIDEMRRHGLITQWSESGIEAATLIGYLRARGIEPRHLRWLRQAADRHVSLVEASFPVRPDAPSRTAAESAEERRRVSAALAMVMLLLIRDGLAAEGSR